MAKDDKSDDSSNKPKGKKPVSREEQAANIKAALDKAGTSAPPTTSTTAGGTPKRRGRGLTAKELASNTQNEPGAKKGSNKKSSSKPSVAKTKAASERRAAYDYAINTILEDYGIDDTDEGRQRARDIYQQQRGIDESGAGVGAIEEQASEVPAGIFRGSTDISDMDYEDIEAGDVDTASTESALRRAGAALGSESGTLAELESERERSSFGAPGGVMEESTSRVPGVKVSRTAELVLGIGARRQPGEVDPADYWSVNQAPQSVEEARAQLEAARARQQAMLDEGIKVRAGAGDQSREADVTAQGTESLAKANKSTDVENRLRLHIAQLEQGIEKGLFGQGPTTLKQRREQGTVGQGVDTTPIQQVRRLGERTDLEGGTDTGLSEEAIKLLRGVGSTEILRKGQSPTGVPNAVSGYIEPTSQADLDKRGDILDLETDPETGESRLANPLERRSPVITDPVTGETRPNPNYPIRSEGGVEIKAGDDGETDETLNAYRETLGGQMVGAKGGDVPEGLVRIKGEGRMGRSYRKRRVRGDYKGPVVTERTTGLGPAYTAMREQVLGGQFGRGRERDADRIIESMIETEGTEAFTEDVINEAAQMSEARPMDAAGDLERVKRGSISSIPVSKRVPVMITRDLDGNPIPPRIETQVGTRSDQTSERTEEGGRRRVNVSLKDITNIIGGPAVVREEPVMETDPKTGEQVQAEDKDYPIDSSRRFRVRRKTYLPADVVESRRVPTVADPNKKVTRVTRGIDVNEANTGQPLKARAFKLYRAMNFGRTNMPPAPEGTPMTLGQQFAQEHGLPRPVYEEGFAAEVGTPEEVRTGFEAQKATERARSQALYEEAQSLPRKSEEERKAESAAASRSRIDRINENKPKLLQQAKTAVTTEYEPTRVYGGTGEGGAVTEADLESGEYLVTGGTKVGPGAKLPMVDFPASAASISGTTTRTLKSGKNKGTVKEVPDTGFIKEYGEALRSSPRYAVEKRVERWSTPKSPQQKQRETEAIAAGTASADVVEQENFDRLVAGFNPIGMENLPSPVSRASRREYFPQEKVSAGGVQPETMVTATVEGRGNLVDVPAREFPAGTSDPRRFGKGALKKLGYSGDYTAPAEVRGGPSATRNLSQSQFNKPQ
jgi:hypothetical protein